MTRRWILVALLPALLLLPACGTVHYDLSSVPVPISAKPETGAGVTIEPLHIDAKSTLWVHGLFGQSSPDVAQLVAEAAQGYDRIAGFRVSVSGGFHDWLITHLTATMVRMKTVVIEGQLVKERRP